MPLPEPRPWSTELQDRDRSGRKLSPHALESVRRQLVLGGAAVCAGGSSGQRECHSLDCRIMADDDHRPGRGRRMADEVEQSGCRRLVDAVLECGRRIFLSPACASCHVCRARRAVEHRTWSGMQSAWRSQRPITGASRRPRGASGRSWSVTSGHADLAWRSSTSVLVELSAMVTLSPAPDGAGRRRRSLAVHVTYSKSSVTLRRHVGSLRRQVSDRPRRHDDLRSGPRDGSAGPGRISRVSERRPGYAGAERREGTADLSDPPPGCHHQR